VVAVRVLLPKVPEVKVSYVWVLAIAVNRPEV
jgi:hypothetical protein